MPTLGVITGEGGVRAESGWAGATDARGLATRWVRDAPCSTSVDGVISGRFENNRWFLACRSSDGGSPCTPKGRFHIEAAAVMPLGNTLGVIEVSKASILRLDDREKTIAAQIIAMPVRPPITPPIIAGVLLEGMVSAQYLVLFDLKAYGNPPI